MASDFAVLERVSIERLRSFCAIVEAGSVVRAAKRNPVKQSQFSRQIRDLEEALGAKFFRREGKRLVLTPDGRQLASLTNAYFAGLGNLAAELRGEGSPMTLGTAESIVRWILTPRFPEVLAAAEASLNVRTQGTAETVERLEAGQIDVGIIRSDAGTDALETLPFPQLRYAFMVPRSRLPEKSATGIHEAGTLPFVLLGGDGKFVQGVKRVSAKNNITLQTVTCVQSFSLAIEVAKVLEAATFVPVQAASEFSADQFAVVAIDGIETIARDLVVAYAKRTAELNTRARRFAVRLSRAFETNHDRMPIGTAKLL